MRKYLHISLGDRQVREETFTPDQVIINALVATKDDVSPHELKSMAVLIHELR